MGGRRRTLGDAPLPADGILAEEQQAAQTAGAQGFLFCMAVSSVGSIILSKGGRLGMQTQESMSDENNFDQNSNPTQPLAIFSTA